MSVAFSILPITQWPDCGAGGTHLCVFSSAFGSIFCELWAKHQGTSHGGYTPRTYSGTSTSFTRSNSKRTLPSRLTVPSRYPYTSVIALERAFWGSWYRTAPAVPTIHP